MSKRFVSLFALIALGDCASHAPAPSGPPPSVSTGKFTRSGISTYVTFDGRTRPVARISHFGRRPSNEPDAPRPATAE